MGWDQVLKALQNTTAEEIKQEVSRGTSQVEMSPMEKAALDRLNEKDKVQEQNNNQVPQ